MLYLNDKQQKHHKNLREWRKSNKFETYIQTEIEYSLS